METLNNSEFKVPEVPEKRKSPIQKQIPTAEIIPQIRLTKFEVKRQIKENIIEIQKVQTQILSTIAEVATITLRISEKSSTPIRKQC